MPPIRKSRVNNDEDVDSDRSIVQWRKFTAEVLKLKCNHLGLVATGKKDILCSRLFNYYQGENVSESQSEVESVPMIATDAPITRDENSMLMLAEIRALRSELCAVKENVKQIELEKATSVHFEVNDEARHQQQKSTENGFVQPATRSHQDSSHRRSADSVQQQQTEIGSNQAAGGFTLPPFVQEIRRSTPGMENLMGILPNEAPVNQFIPPPATGYNS